MRTFLLKQKELVTKSAVAKVTIPRFKPSLLIHTILTVAMAAATSVSFAEQPLSDAEMDTKYIEVKVKPVCTTQDKEEKKQTCHDENSFIAVVTDKPEDKTDSDAAQSKDSNNKDVLLSSVFDNIRLLGGTDVLGVPAGVANTGIPLMFGSENYSFKWSGNLNQIFQPSLIQGVGVIGEGTAFSVYDVSSMGYGFNNEAHFPNGLPQIKIQAVTFSPRN
jgi:hypothetical protein